MLFATFQGKFVENELKTKGVYKLEEYWEFANSNGIVNPDLENIIGDKPIFCIPMTSKRDFLRRLILSSPTMPQRLIIFESDDYTKVGFTSWTKSLYAKYDRDISEVDLVINNDSVYSEYVVPEIDMKNVRKIINITDNDNSIYFFGRTASDDCLDYIYSSDLIDLVNEFMPAESNTSLVLNDIEGFSMELGESFMYYMETINSSGVSDRLVNEFIEFLDKNVVLEAV